MVDNEEVVARVYKTFSLSNAFALNYWKALNNEMERT